MVSCIIFATPVQSSASMFFCINEVTWQLEFNVSTVRMAAIGHDGNFDWRIYNMHF